MEEILNITERLIDGNTDEAEELVERIREIHTIAKRNRPAQLVDTRESKKIKMGQPPVTEKNDPLLMALDKALGGKVLDCSWNHVMFYISMVDPCGVEMVNDDDPATTLVLPGSRLSEVQYKTIMAVGYNIDEIVVEETLTVDLQGMLAGWLSEPASYVPEAEDEDESDPDIIAQKRYVNNKDTFGCLHSALTKSSGPMLDCRVIRAGTP